jgi:hypothetical protein
MSRRGPHFSVNPVHEDVRMVPRALAWNRRGSASDPLVQMLFVFLNCGTNLKHGISLMDAFSQKFLLAGICKLF